MSDNLIFLDIPDGIRVRAMNAVTRDEIVAKVFRKVDSATQKADIVAALNVRAIETCVNSFFNERGKNTCDRR